jgi:uncharacterized protein (DUF302 family)
MDQYIDLISNFSFKETFSILERSIRQRDLMIFAVIDHSSNAEKVGMNMNNCTLLLFGNPTIGTIIMQEDPAIGIELPSKILIYEKDDKTHVRFKHLNWQLDGKSPQASLSKLNSIVDAIAREAAGLNH